LLKLLYRVLRLVLVVAGHSARDRAPEVDQGLLQAFDPHVTLERIAVHDLVRPLRHLSSRSIPANLEDLIAISPLWLGDLAYVDESLGG
jgi:hypothetical protein